MIDQDVKDFISQVKDKKIKWGSWTVDEYFIPDGEFRASWLGYEFSGLYFQADGLSSNCSFKVGQGFTPRNPEADFWSFYAPELGGVELKCTCGAKYTSFPDKHLDWCDLRR